MSCTLMLESLAVLLDSGHTCGWGQDMMGIVAGSTAMEAPLGIWDSF